jgi:hypothetical protein
VTGREGRVLPLERHERERRGRQGGGRQGAGRVQKWRGGSGRQSMAVVLTMQDER